DGQFGNDPNSRFSFPTGTGPVSVSVGDVNQDQLPDLVVTNQGSNDVSILLGNGQGMNWKTTLGPRLQTGGSGPVSTLIMDVTGPNGGGPDGNSDLLVTNQGSNTVTLLPGISQGFFNDQ